MDAVPLPVQAVAGRTSAVAWAGRSALRERGG